MKITKKYLRRIIEQEVQKVLNENRDIKNHEAFIQLTDMLVQKGKLELDPAGALTIAPQNELTLRPQELFDRCTFSVLSRVKKSNCSGPGAMTLKGSPHATAPFDENLCKELEAALGRANQEEIPTPQEVEFDYGP
jgi:hypothetical protein